MNGPNKLDCWLFILYIVSSKYVFNIILYIVVSYVSMLHVIMLNVIMKNVVASQTGRSNLEFETMITFFLV